MLDANILIRAVLGKHVRRLIEHHCDKTPFFVPQAAYEEAAEHLQELVIKRGGDPEKALLFLRSLAGIVDVIGEEIYGGYEALARERLRGRDSDDWPILASALTLGCPIWTEDTDFFGCGVPIWTSDRVHLFLAEPLTE